MANMNATSMQSQSVMKFQDSPNYYAYSSLSVSSVTVIRFTFCQKEIMCIIDDLQDQILYIYIYIKISNNYLAFSNQTACLSKQQELKKQTNENCTNLNCN
jgi:hypothetical protein